MRERGRRAVAALRRGLGRGAPSLMLLFSANDISGLATVIPTQVEGVEPAPHVVLIAVRVINRGGTDLDGVAISVTAPRGLALQACDELGERLSTAPRPSRAAAGPTPGGDAERDSLFFDSLRIGKRGEMRLRFRVTVASAGRYPVTVGVRCPGLDDLLAERDLEVFEAVGELSEHDTISGLIDTGDAILSQPEECLHGAALHREAGGFVFSTTLAVSGLHRPELRALLSAAMSTYTGPRAGDAYLRALVRSRVRVLYEVRHKLQARASA